MNVSTVSAAPGDNPKNESAFGTLNFKTATPSQVTFLVGQPHQKGDSAGELVAESPFSSRFPLCLPLSGHEDMR